MALTGEGEGRLDNFLSVSFFSATSTRKSFLKITRTKEGKLERMVKLQKYQPYVTGKQGKKLLKIINRIKPGYEAEMSDEKQGLLWGNEITDLQDPT